MAAPAEEPENFMNVVGELTFECGGTPRMNGWHMSTRVRGYAANEWLAHEHSRSRVRWRMSTRVRGYAANEWLAHVHSRSRVRRE